MSRLLALLYVRCRTRRDERCQSRSEQQRTHRGRSEQGEAELVTAAEMVSH
jgi:hypothetical protein